MCRWSKYACPVSSMLLDVPVCSPMSPPKFWAVLGRGGVTTVFD